jgi:ParB family chromosome partitioning protein
VAEKRGMGRGLSAILPQSEASAEVVDLPVETVVPNPNQPRTRFSPDALEALSQSIAASGVVQPLIVRKLSDGSYELIAGERRLRAAQMAGLDRVPAVVRDSDEAERMEVALIENMVREDLNPVEEARACAALVEDLGLSKEELGRRVGRSRSQVSNLIRLLDLPDDVLEMLEDGRLSEGHGRAILQVPDHEGRRELGRRAESGDWTVRRIEQEARGIATGERKGGGKGNGLDAEEAEAIEELTGRLEADLGHPVRIRPGRGGLKVEITVEDIDEAGRLADKLARQE